MRIETPATASAPVEGTHRRIAMLTKIGWRMEGMEMNSGHWQPCSLVKLIIRGQEPITWLGASTY